MATNRLLLGVRGERSQPFGQTDGGRHSPLLPFVLVVFFTLASSFGVAYVLATLLVSPPRLSPLPGEVVGVSEAPARREYRRVPLTTPEFDAEAFKRTIIDNNIFRPLGWTPPRPQEPYRLLGTIIPTDAKTPPKSIIQNIVRNQTRIVTIGDTLETDTHVTDIQTKHITLKKNGQQRQLTLKSSFLQRR